MMTSRNLLWTENQSEFIATQANSENSQRKGSKKLDEKKPRGKWLVLASSWEYQF